MTIIAYKFQSPNGSYWYIKADDQRTIEYWQDKRKLTPLTDDEARITDNGAIVELTCPKCLGANFVEDGDPDAGSVKVPCPACFGGAALTTQAPAEPTTLHPLDALLPEICNLIDGCKLDWQAQGCWSEWDQSVRDRITAYNLARLAAVPVKWGDPENVGMLIRQLQTLDPALPVYAAFHTEYQGKRRAFVRGVTVSREHVAGRLVESGPPVNSIVVWSAPVEPGNPANQASNPDVHPTTTATKAPGAAGEARVPFKPETWPEDADGDRPRLCNVCGTPVRYGERHHSCGARK